MKMNVEVSGIVWDLDDDDIEEYGGYDEACRALELDEEFVCTVDVDDPNDEQELENAVDDYIDETYGFCHAGMNPLKRA